MTDWLTKWWRRSQGMPMNRRWRRILLVIYLFAVGVNFLSAGVTLWSGRGSTRLYGVAAFISILSAFFLIGVQMRWLRRTASRVASTASLQERALQEFGKSYGMLSERHQFDVRVRRRREFMSGDRPPDERDEVVQREAERRAFGVLRVALPVLVLAYWAVCLWQPAGPERTGLLVAAVVLSATVIVVVILPDLIRLWTEADATDEVQVLMVERREA
jgi:hypothetical protein